MKPVKKQRVSKASRSIAKGAKAQRDAILQERLENKFDSSAHISHSPMGQAVASGFPLAKR